MKKHSIALFLVILSVLFRTVWHIGPNIEFITTATLLAALYAGMRYAIIVPFFSIVISDVLIGNTSIYIFTWSAFLCTGIVSAIGSLYITSSFRRIAALSLFGIPAGILFYLWTNFGVWLLDPWAMYPDSQVGLLQAYVMGLPFLRSTLVGNSLFGITSAIIAEYLVPFVYRHWEYYFKAIIKKRINCTLTT